jgi:tetratricopeptide (TPR) repeat protein
MIARDHKFWCDYSTRTIGDWITYDTSISNICAFCEKVYVRHDYSDFKGDLKFIRDEDAQKSFSKLRNAVASSIYGWRAGIISQAPPPLPTSPEVRNRMLKESEFALKQSFAYCPFSPEPVYHLIALLSMQGRFEEMKMILQTCHDLDPYNGQFTYWLQSVSAQTQNGAPSPQSMTAQQALTQVQQEVKAGRTNEAARMLDTISRDPQADGPILVAAAELYLQMGRVATARETMEALVKKSPDRWDAWFYLARMQALEGNAAESAKSLTKSFALNPSDFVNSEKITNFHEFVSKDPFFEKIRATPEYQKATNKSQMPEK